VFGSVLVAGVVAAVSARPVAAVQAAVAPAETPTVTALTAADAKPLLGDWLLSAESPQGPVTFTLSLESDADKTVGTIGSDMMDATPITDIVRSGENVLLRYSFDYQGAPVSTVLTLTPSGDTMKATFDFANGAYIMPATATRKKAS
jgi:hypothetical protein